MKVAGPLPVAVRRHDGLVLRGHEWSCDGPPVVFIHDLGDDLDAWGSITARVAAHGFRVISLELRGHGLSDGEPGAGDLLEDTVRMLAEVRASFGPVALVAYGSVTEALLFMDGDCGAPVQVMVAPLPHAPEAIDWRVTRPAVRLLIRGALNERVTEHVNFIYPRMRGQNLQVTGASDRTGPALLLDRPQLFEHLVTFLRRYLTGPHLAWIAEHADVIKARGAERRAAHLASGAPPDQT